MPCPRFQILVFCYMDDSQWTLATALADMGFLSFFGALAVVFFCLLTCPDRDRQGVLCSLTLSLPFFAVVWRLAAGMSRELADRCRPPPIHR